MKVCQVVTGLIPIPNNRWGATEKVIWNYKIALEKLGAECDVLYLNDVESSKYDIVHIHMANLAIEAKKRGIPYVFSIHDHHTEFHGKGSHIYNQNLEAIKGSIFSITHAEHYIELFDGTDKLFYLSHGVDTSFYKPTYKPNVGDYRLLMVANNGMAGNYGIDRKGFIIAIEAAKQLGMELTIIGADANLQFFKIHDEYLKFHDKLTVRYDNPTDDVIVQAYNDHHIFLHPSQLEAGHPNLTLLEAMSCNLMIVGTYYGSNEIPKMVKIDNLTKWDLVEGIKKAKFTYGHLDTPVVHMQYDWVTIAEILKNMYSYALQNQEMHDSKTIKEKYITLYNEL